MTIKKTSNIPDINKAIQQFGNVIPRIIANTSKNHFLEGFAKGGGQTDASASGWKKRKLKLKDFTGGKKTRLRAKRQVGRAILVDTGHLRNDIDVRRANKGRVVIGTSDTDYGVYLNEGTEKMPQREFLGDSATLNKKLNKLVENKLKKALG